MSLPTPPSSVEIEDFLTKYGSLGKMLGSLIQKISPEVREILHTGIGWELIRGDVDRWKDLTIKVLSNDATEGERQECKWLTFDRIPHVAKKITLWYQAMGEMRKKEQQAG